MTKTDAEYIEHRDKMAQASRERSAAGREIGEPPPCVNPERRAAALKSLQNFAMTYFPEIFYYELSDDHKQLFDLAELCANKGGFFAIAMPRGTGKTVICLVVVLWVILSGEHKYIVFIGATNDASEENMLKIRQILESNDLLYDDFPEACFPIRKIDGSHIRCKGQTINGVRTKISLSAEKLILPRVDGALCSEAIIQCAGMTARIRGKNYMRTDGRVVRPSLVIIDDPQTEESAYSFTQTDKRIKTIDNAITNLPAPGQKIAVLMPCTVICPGDLADHFLDSEKNPDWFSVRMKLLNSFPTNMNLWEKYAEIRADSLRVNKDISIATEFYKQNLDAMREGAEVSWTARYNNDEVDGIQYAMNLYFKNKMSFYSEFQNDPRIEDAIKADVRITLAELMGKLNGISAGVVGNEVEKITAFIDVQQNLLYYVVCSWRRNFAGEIIEYGTFPQQNDGMFDTRSARIRIEHVFPGQSLEMQLYNAADALTSDLISRKYACIGDGELPINKILIDANWAASQGSIYQLAVHTQHKTVIFPAHGKFVGAGNLPMTEYSKRPGEKLGFNWLLSKGRGKRTTHFINFDANFWKSFCASRLKMAIVDKGINIYGDAKTNHELLFEHLTAEYSVRTTGRGRVVDEWKIRPDKTENHWWDCLVGCAVGASVEGISLEEIGVGDEKKRKRLGEKISLAAKQREGKK